MVAGVSPVDLATHIVKTFAPLHREQGAVVLIGDGVKQSKEARYMPGVKKLHQESENSSKAEYIFGHLFGAVGILMGTSSKLFCLPLFLQLQDGVKTIFGWGAHPERQDSHVVQMIGGLAYHFWSKSMPKLKRYLKKGELHPLEQVTNEKDQKNIRLTIKAIEGYVMCSCIAMGLLQLIAVKYSHRVPARFFRYLRTPSNVVVSEATVMVYLRKSIFRMFAHNPHLSITKIIHSKQITPDSDGDLLAS